MEWVEKFNDRILDLGGEIKAEGTKLRDLIANPIDYIKEDLKIQVAGVDLLYKCMETLKDDPTADRKEVDNKAFAELKKEGAIVSPVRCKWEPAK